MKLSDKYGGRQEKKTTDVSIEGHVYEPAKLAPSDELIGTYRRGP